MTEKTNSFKMVKKVLNKKAAEMIKKGNQRDLVIIDKEVKMALDDGYTQKAIECYLKRIFKSLKRYKNVEVTSFEYERRTIILETLPETEKEEYYPTWGEWVKEVGYTDGWE